jgi:hypothetical protein
MAVNGQLLALAVLSLVRGQLVPLKYEVEWVPEIVWTFWRREEVSLALAGVGTSDHSAHCLVTISNTLFQITMKELNIKYCKHLPIKPCSRLNDSNFEF